LLFEKAYLITILFSIPSDFNLYKLRNFLNRFFNEIYWICSLVGWDLELFLGILEGDLGALSKGFFVGNLLNYWAKRRLILGVIRLD
jgi:hypothetical protein